MANTNNQNSFLDYSGLALFWNNVKNVIEDNELVTATALTDLDTRVDTLEKAATVQIISKPYLELKTLRDNSQLVPGQLYRITDYTCTTAQTNTKSAGHQFDIIVTADSKSVLNEEARAVNHEFTDQKQDHFKDCNLSAWKIWYCLDNDTNRFAWADSANGKGVIYRMIDEFNNDVPYDFKNIQFYRQWNSDESLWITIPSNNTGVPCYTFSSEGDSSTTSFTDYSLASSNNVCCNAIKPQIRGNNKQFLNNICFFGNDCHTNTFGNDCHTNTFGNGCYRNTFGNGCYRNTFGYNCSSNTFGDDCNSNTFRPLCDYNTFGNSCCSNIFGGSFSANSFGNRCIENSFGTECAGNTFGNYCYNITFGNNCNGNTFGNNCSLNTFGDTYYQHNHFGDGCWYILLRGTETASPSAQVQNYNFAQGLQGTDRAYITIDGVRNRSFETKVAKNSNGEPKIYCEADLIL